MLEAWSERMEGFEEKKEEATMMVYEENCIYHVRGNMFYVSVSLAVCECVQYNIYTWMFAMMMSGYERFCFPRARFCVTENAFAMENFF